MDDKIGTWVWINDRRGVGLIIGRSFDCLVVTPTAPSFGYVYLGPSKEMPEAPVPDPVPEHLAALWAAFEARRQLIEVAAEVARLKRDQEEHSERARRDAVRDLLCDAEAAALRCDVSVPMTNRTLPEWLEQVIDTARRQGVAVSAGTERGETLHAAASVILACAKVLELGGIAELHVRLAVAYAARHWLAEARKAVAAGKAPASWGA